MKQHIKLFEEFSSESEFKHLSTKEEVIKWLENHVDGLIMKCVYVDENNNLLINVEDYFDSEDEEYNEPNSVYIRTDEERIPVHFGTVESNFSLSGNKNLNSLKGSPVEVIYGDYHCEKCPRLLSLEGITPLLSNGGEVHCEDCNLQPLIYLPTNKWSKNGYVTVYYEGNPCEDIYNEYGITDEAHARALGQWYRLDPVSHKEFMERLKENDIELYNLMTSKQGRLWMGLESEDLQNAYQISKDVEGDFY